MEIVVYYYLPIVTYFEIVLENLDNFICNFDMELCFLMTSIIFILKEKLNTNRSHNVTLRIYTLDVTCT